ncbi:MAG: nucleotidyl transferase AbiEii/AbiGii toxin family protein [Flexilinea sp.]|nr:nucleotidyl transferase AbiEii/AbiGii toxin family protein [Flexilinea sp.]
MHPEILDPERSSLLQTICENIDLTGFYLAGGTGLSLQMRLRRSYDFGFFTQNTFNENSLVHSLEPLFPNGLEGLTLNKGTCSLLINGIQVSFFEYPYPLIQDAAACEQIQNLYLAGIPDIAAMKMSAIGGRGAKKDFFDLYQIFTKAGISAGQMLDLLRIKYGDHFNYSYILMGLDYFDDAEQELLPELFVDFDWDEAKRFFIQKKKEFLDLAYSDQNLLR